MKLNTKIMIFALIGLNLGLIQANNINYALANNAATISTDIANLAAIINGTNGLTALISGFIKQFCPRNKCTNDSFGAAAYALNQNTGNYYTVTTTGVADTIIGLSLNNVSINTVNYLISNYSNTSSVITTLSTAVGIPAISDLYLANQNLNAALQKLLADLNSAVINFSPYTVTFIQNIQTQINALNSYKSTISGLGSDFNNYFNSVLANNIITYCAPITAASLVSSPANNVLASTIDTNIYDRIVGNSSALKNSITALTSPKSGLGQLGNWWKNPPATAVTAMQNAIIACNNIIALINAFGSKAAVTITPFITPTPVTPAQPVTPVQPVKPTTPIPSSALSAATYATQVVVQNFSGSTQYLALINHNTDFSGFVTAIKNNPLMLSMVAASNPPTTSQAAAIYLAAIGTTPTNRNNANNIDDFIWNLNQLIQALTASQSNPYYAVSSNAPAGMLSNLLDSYQQAYYGLTGYKNLLGMTSVVPS